MTDLERLREHLELYDNGMGVYDDTTPTTEALADAARSYLRILEADDHMDELVLAFEIAYDEIDKLNHEEFIKVLKEHGDYEDTARGIRAVLARLGGNE